MENILILMLKYQDFLTQNNCLWQKYHIKTFKVYMSGNLMAIQSN